MTTTVDNLSPYRRLYQTLRRRIVSGELTGQLPSIAELAKHHQVNHNTVKRALSQLKEQRFVYGQQGRGVFVNPDGAMSLLAQKHVILYLHQEELSNPFYSRLVYEMRSRLERERCAVGVINTLSQLQAFAGQIDVLLLFEHFQPQEIKHIEALVPRQRIICCNCRGPEGCWSVGTDNRAGGYLAMSHLYEQGCRQVGVLGIGFPGTENIFAQRRLGLVDFRDEHPDLTVDLIEIPMPFVLERLGAEWARRLFRENRQPDGIFLFMDIMAFSAYHVCHELNHWPLILGFDDQTFAEQLFPPLSSMRENSLSIADETARIIQAILSESSYAEQRLIPPDLIERESTQRPTGRRRGSR